MRRPFIKIKEGKMTYGQRIDLGVILGSKTTSESQKFSDVFKCLYGEEIKIKEFNDFMLQYEEVLSGLTFWIEQEKTMLKYEPSLLEVRAGLSALIEKIGDFGTVKSLAKAYGKDPDEILNWEYAKVFGILYTDLEESKYQKKYQEISQKK